MSGTQRLINLLELANQGPAMRAALAEEVADLLTDWPPDCPLEMKASCEALLARSVREVDEDTKARLRIRLHADPSLAARILPREAQDRSLVETVRANEDLGARLSRALGISEDLGREILRDQTGHSLAVAAKALGLNRAAFSGLTVLSQALDSVTAYYARLDAFEAISAVEAARELRRWNREPARAA